MKKTRDVKPRKIVDVVPEEVLLADLERYRRRAIEMGATDARIISAAEVIIDERVQAKCINPKCERYGTNLNCPPYAMSPDLMRKIVGGYRYAVLTMMQVPSVEATGPEALEKHTNARTSRLNHDIVTEIEALAFLDGYYLANGFADASCKSVHCPNLECAALKPGGSCRFPLQSRSSMEAVGIDAFRMAARAGWDIYPITASVPPQNVPFAVKLGLILIY